MKLTHYVCHYFVVNPWKLCMELNLMEILILMELIATMGIKTLPSWHAALMTSCSTRNYDYERVWNQTYDQT